MGVSFSLAVSAVAAGGLILAGGYGVANNDLSPFADKAFHPLYSLGEWVQRQMYPFEIRRDDLADTARAQVIRDPALMPKAATPCDTVWRAPIGDFLFGSISYEGAGMSSIGGASGHNSYSADKNVLTPGANHGPDDGHVTAVAGVSPALYNGRNRLSMMQFIQRRVFGDNPITDDGLSYNKALFNMGSPWPRARNRFEGYYAFNVNGRMVPFLPPAVQRIPVIKEPLAAQWDGYPSLDNQQIEGQVTQIRNHGAWHWVNITQWPTAYRTVSHLGPARVQYGMQNYNQVERDIIDSNFKSYDMINRGKPQEAATLEWYPVGTAYAASNSASGFQMVNLAESYAQYVPLSEWPLDALRTYIRTYLAWNPEDLVWVDTASHSKRKRREKMSNLTGVF